MVGDCFDLVVEPDPFVLTELSSSVDWSLDLSFCGLSNLVLVFCTKTTACLASCFCGQGWCCCLAADPTLYHNGFGVPVISHGEEIREMLVELLKPDVIGTT